MPRRKLLLLLLQLLPLLSKNQKARQNLPLLFLHLYKDSASTHPLSWLSESLLPFAVIPKTGRKRKLLVVIYFLITILKVKETSSKPVNGLSNLLVILLS